MWVYVYVCVRACVCVYLCVGGLVFELVMATDLRQCSFSVLLKEVIVSVNPHDWADKLLSMPINTTKDSYS